MIANLAGQPIGCQMTKASDGSEFTGAVTVYVTGDNGTQAIGANGGGLCTHDGHGYHAYQTALADTAFSRHIAFTFVGSGAITRTIQVGLPYALMRSRAGQTVGCQMTTAADGSDFAGAVVVEVTGDNGSQALGGSAVLKGHGYYGYSPALADTPFGLVAFTFVGTGALTQTIEIQTVTETQAAVLVEGIALGACTARDLVIDALAELNVYDAADAVSPADSALVLRRLNRILDNFNAERDAVYADQYASYTLTPSLSPHTIGPTGNFVVTQRPVSIEGISLIYPTSTSPQIGLNARDRAWYQGLSIPAQTASLPTDFYYEPAWPNGRIYFWPVPTTAYSIVLWSRIVLSQLSINDTFTLPPGYRDALTLTLAEAIAPSFEKSVPSSLTRDALAARARVFQNNVVIPRLYTNDSGMPSAQGRGGGTYLTGWWR